MKRSIAKIVTYSALFVVIVSGCRQEDPGPLQSASRSFPVVNFDRVEAADAMDVTIQQGSTFSINTDGDRRDLDDLQIIKQGTTLIVKYNKGRNRQYTTYVTITMPVIYGLSFSGAVTARTAGFIEPTNRFDLALSGGSFVEISLKAEEVYASVSGASTAELSGSGKMIDANLSGASKLMAFDYPVEQANVVASGASRAAVKASQQLTVSASGASEIRYRGEPQVDTDVSGASFVNKD